MIYKLSTGVDNQIREKVITAAVIIGTTVGVPALAAVVNDLSPFQSGEAGPVLGVSSDEEASAETGSNVGDNDNPETSVSADQQNRLSASSNSSMSLGHAAEESGIEETCACPKSPGSSSSDKPSSSPPSNDDDSTPDSPGSPGPVGGGIGVEVNILDVLRVEAEADGEASLETPVNVGL